MEISDYIVMTMGSISVVLLLLVLYLLRSVYKFGRVARPKTSSEGDQPGDEKSPGST